MKNKLILFAGLLLIVNLVTLSGCKKNDNYGNANITTSTFTVNTWQAIGSYYSTILNVPSITASVQSSGTADVFVSFDSGTSWNALPYNLGTDYTFMYSTHLNSVRLYFYHWGVSTGIDPNTYMGATCQVKVVVTSPLN